MNPVHISSREPALVNWCRDIFGPQAVHAILDKEVKAGSFTKTEYASELLGFLCHDMHLYPVEVIVIHKTINSEELSLALVLIQELNLEGSSSNLYKQTQISL